MNNYHIDDHEYDKICALCNIKVSDLSIKWSKSNYPGIEEFDKNLIREKTLNQLEN